MTDQLDGGEQKILESDEDESDKRSYREILPDDRKKIVEAHELWAQSGFKDGEQADFRYADLKEIDFQGADLRWARLQDANLWGANLEKAKLSSAYLEGARLFRAKLHGANLRSAKLRKAHLKDVHGLNQAQLQNIDLREATGLIGMEFAGTDVTGAKLPDDIANFDAVNHVAEISKHARTIFLGVVGACVYSWLSIATTTDVALITGSTVTPLPIIQTPVSIAGFYWAAPPILFVLYVYLHLYLQRMWEGMAELPAVFPDGRTLDKRVYPWLLSGLVAANVALLKERRPPSSWLQVGLSVIAAWGLVPFTLFLFWGRYLTRHDWPWTIWHVILFVAAAAYGFASYRLATATLRGEALAGQGIVGRAERPKWRHLFQGLRNVEHRWVLATAILTSILSLGAIEGTPGGETRNWRSWVPSPTSLFRIRTSAELTELDVSTKPVNWTGLWERPFAAMFLQAGQVEVAKAELAQVKGAQLRDADLRGAIARGAFMARADLRNADLRGADLTVAFLQEARLRGADLRHAILSFTELYMADLQDADLRGAVLSSANLQEADLRGANLLETIGLGTARLDGACGDNRTKLPPKFTIEICNPGKR